MEKNMMVGLLAPLFNTAEQQFIKDLQAKIKAIGYQVELATTDLSRYQILVVIFDGRPLLPVDYLKMGLFASQIEMAKPLNSSVQRASTGPSRLMVGYLTSAHDYLGEEKKYLQHLATTELNLISCLKDYIYFHQRG